MKERKHSKKTLTLTKPVLYIDSPGIHPFVGLLAHVVKVCVKVPCLTQVDGQVHLEILHPVLLLGCTDQMGVFLHSANNARKERLKSVIPGVLNTQCKAY